MRWSIASLMLPYFATALPPYKRFVSPPSPTILPSRENLIQWSQDPRADAISWGPCSNSSEVNFECGYFEVPLDWANESAGKARLAVVKYGATNSPRKGALLFNPGPSTRIVLQRATPTYSSYRRSWCVRCRQYHWRQRSTSEQLDWWILRHRVLGSEGCWSHNVSFHPSLLPSYPSSPPPLAYSSIQPWFDQLLQLS